MQQIFNLTITRQRTETRFSNILKWEENTVSSVFAESTKFTVTKLSIREILIQGNLLYVD